MRPEPAAVTMDSRICFGVAASFGWSLYALFWGAAGAPDMDDHFRSHHRIDCG
jgi:Cu+-exporting ATPase